MKVCKYEGCGKPHDSRGYCKIHAQRLRRTGSVEVTMRRRGTGHVREDGYHRFATESGLKYAHRLVAEVAIGRELKRKEIVHHIDGNPENNAPDNLVLCPSQAYHKLLHKRQDALNAVGNPDARKCVYCGEYDLPSNMRNQSKGSLAHRECANRARRKYKKRD